jgi:hypothetical protein
LNPRNVCLNNLLECVLSPCGQPLNVKITQKGWPQAWFVAQNEINSAHPTWAQEWTIKIVPNVAPSLVW